VGQAPPGAIVPSGVHAYVDAKEQVIRFDYKRKKLRRVSQLFLLYNY